MKNTGITRKVDDMGRIVLPIELRRNLNIDDGTPLEISVDGNNIVLSPVAVPLTEKEIVDRAKRPVFLRGRWPINRNTREWIVVRLIWSWGVVGTNGNEYKFVDFDFYDREVPHQ